MSSARFNFENQNYVYMYKMEKCFSSLSLLSLKDYLTRLGFFVIDIFFQYCLNYLLLFCSDYVLLLLNHFDKMSGKHV